MLRPRACNLETNVVRHPINVLVRLDGVIGELPTPIAPRKVLVKVKLSHILNEERVQSIFANLTESTD